MYRIIICFFSFTFITQNVRSGKSEKEGVINDWDVRTHRGDGAVLLWNLLAFLLRSLYLHDWHRATSRHQSVFDFPRFSTFTSLVPGHPKESNHLSFSYLLRAVRYKAWAQSDMTYNSASACLRSTWVEIDPDLHNFPDTQANMEYGHASF